MEIIIIVLLLASLFGVWLVSVRRKLELQEENIRNAMHQTLVQLSAEWESLERLAELLGHTMGAETFRKMKLTLESAQNVEMTGMPEWITEQQRELLRVQKNIAEISETMPLLQAQETYQKYWKAAKSYEHMVKTSELIYNDSVENYNCMLHTIPDCIAAGICGYHRKKLIEIM